MLLSCIPHPGFVATPIAATPANPAFGPNRRLVRKISRDPHVRASNESESQEGKDVAPVSLKVMGKVLQDARGVGLIFTVGLAYASGLIKKSVEGIASFTEAEMGPVIEEAPENIKTWPKTLSNAWLQAGIEARKSLVETGANMNDAWSEFLQETESLNQKMSHEADIGAKNWKKTTDSITAALETTSSSSKESNSDALAVAEEKAARLMTSVRDQLKDAGTKAKEGGVLRTGWGSAIIGQPVPQSPRVPADEPVAAVPPEVEAPESSTKASGFGAAISGVVKRVTGFKEDALLEDSPVPEAAQAMAATSESAAALPPLVADPPPTATPTKSSLDGSLKEVTKGGRHISMLSAPISVSNNGSALGWSSEGSSPSSSTLGRGAGGDALGSGLAASVAAVTAAAATTAAVRANGGGGGNGNSGGGGGGGDDSSSGNSNNSDDNSQSWLFLLLITLAIAGGLYYYKNRQAEAEASPGVRAGRR